MDKNEIGNRLRELRGNKKRKDVAEAVGITASALANYECGLRVPKDEIKVKLAEYYKKSVKTIFFS